MQKIQGPILLLAVPGSGKTMVLVTRLGYLLYCCGVRPEETLTMFNPEASVLLMETNYRSTPQTGLSYRTKTDIQMI